MKATRWFNNTPEDRGEDVGKGTEADTGAVEATTIITRARHPRAPKLNTEVVASNTEEGVMARLTVTEGGAMATIHTTEGEGMLQT